MPPPSNGPRRNNDNFSQGRSVHPTDMARSAGVARVRNDDSWVEISSAPSSSSLSSIGDEIVTTGLQIHHDPRRRRRQRGTAQTILETRQTSTSSQEEYEESESEEDHVMTSSTEHIIPLPAPDSGSDSDDDDENATALGRRTEPAFTPQPNAFSHPPSSQRSIPSSSQRAFPPQRSSDSYFPPQSSRSTYPTRVPPRQPLNPQDHDAALRASLTTLLSIGAAAARGLPKRDQGSTITTNAPMGLRFIPESELMATTAPANTSRSLSTSTRPRSTPSVSSQESKRKASPAKSGEKSRALKKKRVQADEVTYLSPTFLTWVMSAGVVVLVSVVGFGAGYVIGREVGRQEAMAGLNGTTLMDNGSCGREALRGGSGSLKRFKWGIGGATRGVVA